MAAATAEPCLRRRRLPLRQLPGHNVHVMADATQVQGSAQADCAHIARCLARFAPNVLKLVGRLTQPNSRLHIQVQVCWRRYPKQSRTENPPRSGFGAKPSTTHKLELPDSCAGLHCETCGTLACGSCLNCCAHRAALWRIPFLFGCCGRLPAVLGPTAGQTNPHTLAFIGGCRGAATLIQRWRRRSNPRGRATYAKRWKYLCGLS